MSYLIGGTLQNGEMFMLRHSVLQNGKEMTTSMLLMDGEHGLSSVTQKCAQGLSKISIEQE